MTTGELGAHLADVFFIGCGEDVSAVAQAWPSSMGLKAWNLLRMAQMSLPVPPAFVIGTRYCLDEQALRGAVIPAICATGLAALARHSGLAFGDARRPLLLSVRSGAPVSMPGMMETLLNIGLCERTVGGLLRRTGNPRLVWDAYRRLVATYGEVVEAMDAQVFEQEAALIAGVRDERDIDFAELRELTQRYLRLYEQQVGKPFPQDPLQQLSAAIEAVFHSWRSPKACEYRRVNNLADSIGTAVTVQAMVFGNAGGTSGAGVGFTRDPATGQPKVCVDFLFNAQGEDVVSGRRSAHGHDELAAVLPAVWDELQAAARRLEAALGDMQDFEFTVQEAQLYMLQTRHGKRTPLAAARIALDMLDEGLVTAEQARERVTGLSRAALAQTSVVSTAGERLAPIGRAKAASNGVATGAVALDEACAARWHLAGRPVILVRRNAETADIGALASAAGLLTQRGARTSHAAVVARQLGKVCLVGCDDLEINEQTRTLTLGGTTLGEGEMLSLDGNDGSIYSGAVATRVDYPEALLERLATLVGGSSSMPPWPG